MASINEQIETSRHVDERSATWRLWLRRAGVTALTAVPIVALFNLLGQRATTTTRSTPAVSVSVHAPSRVRAGLLFQAKITITARRTLPNVILDFSNGWIDGLTLNTNEPVASSETTTGDGGIAMSIGTLQANQPYIKYLEYQVNPTSWGTRSQHLVVTSNHVALVRIDRSMTVVP